MIKIRKFIRINEQIREKEIRVIGPQGEQLGILPLEKGLELAEKYGLDLVEVAPQVQPSVCRIMDFSKYKYDQEKKEKEARRRQRQFHIKELRIKPNIEEHDYQVKLKYLEKFLKKGDKVKINLFFRGREMMHLDLGKRILDRFINDSKEFGQPEKEPVLEGRIMSMVMAPK